MNKNTFNALVLSLSSATFLSGCDCSWEETNQRKQQCLAEEQTAAQENANQRRNTLLQSITPDQENGITLFVSDYLEFSPISEDRTIADYILNQDGKNVKSALESGAPSYNLPAAIPSDILSQIFKCNETRSPTGSQRWVDQREETEYNKTAVETQIKMCIATQSVELSGL